VQLPRLDRQRLSTLAALVLLSYGLIRVVVLPEVQAQVTFLGLVVRIDINAPLVLLSLAAALAVAGADWLIRVHPHMQPGQVAFEHWVVPGLAALGVGAILTRIPDGAPFWIGLGLAAVLLVSVIAAEFIVVDPADPRFDPAAIGLRALSYLLLIGTLFAIRAAGMRAAFAVPLILVASGAVAWRLLRLTDPLAPQWLHGALIGGVTAQIAWGLHYWPISPLREALLLGTLVYLAGGIVEARRGPRLERRQAVELAVVGAVALAAIFLLT
jgi:hypothetical protein